jgi:hypothetical protein
MAKAGDKSGRKGPAVTGKKEYNISAEQFIRAWERGESVDDVFEELKGISEKNKWPVMPKPIILSRAAEYRSLKIPLKKMRRPQSVDVQRLTELVKQLQGAKQAVGATPTPASEVNTPPATGLSPEQVEQVERVVVQVLKTHGLLE